MHTAHRFHFIVAKSHERFGCNVSVCECASQSSFTVSQLKLHTTLFGSVMLLCDIGNISLLVEKKKNYRLPVLYTMFSVLVDPLRARRWYCPALALDPIQLKIVHRELPLSVYLSLLLSMPLPLQMKWLNRTAWCICVCVYGKTVSLMCNVYREIERQTFIQEHACVLGECPFLYCERNTVHSKWACVRVCVCKHCVMRARVVWTFSENTTPKRWCSASILCVSAQCERSFFVRALKPYRVHRVWVCWRWWWGYNITYATTESIKVESALLAKSVEFSSSSIHVWMIVVLFSFCITHTFARTQVELN